jgi:RNA polymerase sigma factor (sigma-70 family)
MPAEFPGVSTGDEDTPGARRPAGLTVYGDFTEPLFDYCAGLLGDQVAAASAVQDSLVDVNAARISERPEPGQLRIWLYSAARRQCLARRSGRRPRSPGPAGPTATDQLDAATPGLQDAGERRETLLVVTAALASLADRDREVLSLSFRHGLQAVELAAVLGLSPRRARRRLSRASARFRKSAAVAAVLRAGWLGCYVLARIAGQQDPAPPPLASKLGRRLDGHVASCPACARTLGHQAWGPELISQVPLVAPVRQLQLRIIRTAHAQASYRGQVGSFTSGGIPAVRPRGVPKAMVASSAALAVLAALGVLLYTHESTLAASPRPSPAKVTRGTRSPAAASPSRLRELPDLPAPGAPVLGVLPGLPLGQAGSSSPWPPPKHANPSRTPVPTPIPNLTTPSPVVAGGSGAVRLPGRERSAPQVAALARAGSSAHGGRSARRPGRPGGAASPARPGILVGDAV